MSQRIKKIAMEYYPVNWDIERLKNLVKAGKLTENEFKEIAGEDYTKDLK